MRISQVSSVAAVVSILLLGSVGAGREPSGEHLGLAEAFFERFDAGRPNEAIDEMFATNPWATRKADEMENLKRQFAGLPTIMGERHGREIIFERKVGERFVHVTYVVFYDRQPVRFNFQFYKPSDAWMVFSFNYDFNLPQEVAASSSVETMLREQQR